MSKNHARQCFDLHIADSLALYLREVPNLRLGKMNIVDYLLR